MPFFSIITVCKNEEKRIQKTLNSLEEQTFNDYEYIIVDGKSVDDTIRIVNEWEQSNSINVSFFSESDDGIYDAMNKGIQKAKGEYIFFLNAGDVFYDNMVLEHVWNNIGDERPCIWVGRIWIIDNLKQYVREPLEPAITFENGMGYTHQALFARYDIIKFGFNTKYEIYADYAWECEQYIAGKNFKIGENIICKYYENGVSAQNSRIKERWKELFSIWHEYFPEYYKKRVRTWKEDWEYEKGKIRLKLLHELFDLSLKEYNVLDYITENVDTTIAVYGYGDVGQCLVDKLLLDGARNVLVIDRAYKFHDKKIRLLRPDDDLSNVDILVITSIVDFYEIREKMNKKYSFSVVSFEDLLNKIFFTMYT